MAVSDTIKSNGVIARLTGYCHYDFSKIGKWEKSSSANTPY